MRMTPFRRSRTVAGIALGAAFMVLAGCATQETVVPVGIEPKIEHASNRAQHEDLAAWYEEQAAMNAAAAKRHQGYAATYRRNTSPRGSPDAHLALAVHCENLAKTYQLAADQSLVMARLHRDLAAQAR